MATRIIFGKKISETGQEAVRQTKNMAKIVKLNTKISDDEKMIEEQYKKIGELFFEKNCDKYDELEEPYCQIVNDTISAMDRVRQYQKQINRMKGICICTNCDAEVPYGATFCSACGNKIEYEEKRCRKCGSFIGDDELFCSNCGTKVESQNDNTDKNAIMQEDQIEAVCVNCGEKLDCDAIFCPQCGTKRL